jgi:hypothetical protein
MAAKAKKQEAQTEVALTASRLRELLSYDAETGVFVWRVHHRPKMPGDRAGGFGHGYIQIRLDGRLYYAHRLAWLYVTGEWPDEQIDHINGDGVDNRFANLRPCSNDENQKNLGLRKTNTSGFSGVRWDKERQKWAAHIRINGKVTQLGRFNSKDEARTAYLVKRAEVNPFQPTPRA